MNLPHISASSVSKFVECAAKFAVEKTETVVTRSKFTDAGVLVHGALEQWRNPAHNHPKTYEALEACYLAFAKSEGMIETYEVFKRGLELLKKAYTLTSTHPTIPLHLATTIAVETEIAGYQPDGWALPLKGFIDHVFILTPDPAKPTEIILGVEDYKTGKPKSWTELTNEDIQAVLYAAWTRDVLVPHITAQGYTVQKIVLVWTYINDGQAVPIYENDLDIDFAKSYVASISHQMVTFVETWNALPDTAEARDAFLRKYETPNAYCGYCVRKNTCSAFQTLLRMDRTIDITTADWVEVRAERQRAAALQKFGESRKKEIDDLIRLCLDQERLDGIEAGDIEFYANQQTNKSHRLPIVAETLGIDFVLRAASITQNAMEAELARIALIDSEKAKEIRGYLESNMDFSPGPRIVRERKVRSAVATSRKPAKKESVA